MFVDFYKENKSDKEARSEAKIRLVTNMITSPVFGKDKLMGVDSTDMESMLDNKFYPGLIYTFLYTSDGDFVNGIPFGDYIPIILCCSVSSKFVEGINLNMLPNEHRAVFLDGLDKMCGKYLSEIGPSVAMSGNLAVSSDLASILIDDNKRLAIFNVFQQMTGCGISRAYRKYNMSHLTGMRLIEYCDYKYIPVLSYEGSIRDANILKIQQETVSKG